MSTVAPPRVVRIAAYCRKSHVAGLDQAFNSLDAQREAIANYVASQKGAGWTLLDTDYSDGGISGATMDRPGFQRLLADVVAGKVDGLVVYRLDRLSRRFTDYIGILQLLEQHHALFASVSEQFTTSTPTGRLVLHQLALFAEFERATIAERVRDKVRAAKRRGLWCGGRPVLGYDVIGKRLVVNTDEAQQVSSTFQLYLERGTLRATVEELRRRGWRNKSFTTKKGTTATGNEFSLNTLHALLCNAIYIGLVKAGTDLVAGAHDAVVPRELWDAAQAQLRANSNDGGVHTKNKTGALLRGLLRCKRCGSTMTHSFSTKKDRRHRYYVCNRLHTEGAEACPGSRVAAGPFETFVCNQIKVIGTDEQLLAKTADALERGANEHREPLEAELRRGEREMQRIQGDDERARVLAARLADVRAELAAFDHATEPRLRGALASFSSVWDALFTSERERIVRLLIEHITFDPETRKAEFELRPCGIAALAQETTK